MKTKQEILRICEANFDKGQKSTYPFLLSWFCKQILHIIFTLKNGLINQEYYMYIPQCLLLHTSQHSHHLLIKSFTKFDNKSDQAALVNLLQINDE